MSILYRWSKNIQVALIGPRCTLCQAAAPLTRDLCVACEHDMPWLDAACRHCALPLATQANMRICQACQRQAVFDRAIAAFHYAPPVDWLITRLKFHGRMPHARLLGDLLADRAEREAIDAPDRFVPVPLHPTSFRERGFNQAERIATRLARRLQRPVARDVAARVRATERQSTLAAGRRRANVRDAFANTARLDGAHVALVDDVVTTGHTVRALGAVLRAAGATRVDLYCVARA